MDVALDALDATNRVVPSTDQLGAADQLLTKTDQHNWLTGADSPAKLFEFIPIYSNCSNCSNCSNQTANTSLTGSNRQTSGRSLIELH